jgi:hypothetical protein
MEIKVDGQPLKIDGYHSDTFVVDWDGGGVAPGGRISVDSGVLNPELHPVEEWRDETFRRRITAAIANEYEEAIGGTHEYAVEHAPETELPVGEPVRKMLRAIRLHEQGFGGGRPSRSR